MLECVEPHRETEVVEKRTKYGCNVVTEWNSKDFFFIPDTTIITVDVKGKFMIPKESSLKFPKLSFIPVARENFTLFLVNLKACSLYGILSIRDNKSMLYEICYDPASTIRVPPNRSKRYCGLSNPRPSTAGLKQIKDSAVEFANDNKNGIYIYIKLC